MTGIKAKNHLLVLDPLLWSKLNWLCDHMPGRQSQQKLVRAGVEKFVAELIAQHYKQ